MVVEDLSDDLLTYDQSYKTFIPYLGIPTSSYSIYKGFSGFFGYDLTFNAYPGLSLFSNYKLIYENVTDSAIQVVLPVISIVPRDSKKSLLTFFHPDSKLPGKVVITHSSSDLSLTQPSEAEIHIRNQQPKESLFTLFLVVLLGLVLLKVRYPKMLSDYIGLGRTSNAEDNISMLDFFSGSSLLIISVNSASMAYIFSVVKVTNGEVFNWFSVFFLFVFLFVGFYIKYLIINVFGSIFSLSSFCKSHFLEIVRITLIFNLVTVPLLTIVYFSELIDLKISYMGFLSGLTTALVIVLFKLIVLTFRVPDFKYIYLFSYLCLAEIIPLGFAIKITLL